MAGMDNENVSSDASDEEDEVGWVFGTFSSPN